MGYSEVKFILCLVVIEFDNIVLFVVGKFWGIEFVFINIEVLNLEINRLILLIGLWLKILVVLKNGW